MGRHNQHGRNQHRTAVQPKRPNNLERVSVYVPQGARATTRKIEDCIEKKELEMTPFDIIMSNVGVHGNARKSLKYTAYLVVQGRFKWGGQTPLDGDAPARQVVCCKATGHRLEISNLGNGPHDKLCVFVCAGNELAC